MDATWVETADQSKSIEELEGSEWAQASGSYVVETSLALRRKRLGDLTDEDLRIGLEQQIGLVYLTPLAIERLWHNPLCEARLYEGDLLHSVLSLPADFWDAHPQWHEAVRQIATKAIDEAGHRSPDWQNAVLPALQDVWSRFLSGRSSGVWLRQDQGRASPPPTLMMAQST